MIPHHSTALTSSHKLIQNSNASKKEIYRLAKDIIYNQEQEIALMKNLV